MKTILASVLAVAAVACIGTGAASAQTARIPFGDLNLASASGAATFDARIAVAARAMCRNATRPASRLNDIAYCTAAVRAEALAQLPSRAKLQYAATRQTITL